MLSWSSQKAKIFDLTKAIKNGHAAHTMVSIPKNRLESGRGLASLHSWVGPADSLFLRLTVPRPALDLSEVTIIAAAGTECHIPLSKAALVGSLRLFLD